MLFTHGEGWAQESPDLPVHHRAYEIAERLSSRGLLETLLLNAKPVSRFTMAYSLVDLLAQIDAGEVPAAVLETGSQDEILKFLAELQREVDDLEGTAPTRFLNYRIADPLSLELGYASLSRDRRRLRENHWGDFFYEGLNTQLRLRSGWALGRHLSWVLAPKVTGNRDGAVGTLEEGLLKGSFKNIEVAVGREGLWWGPGFHGALLLSDNAPSLNLVKIGSRQPFHLPFFLERLGLWQVTTFLAQLETGRDFSHTRLLGLRVGYRPFSFLELGLSRTTQFGGEGRPGFSFVDVLELYFTRPNQGGGRDVNELASFDVSLRLPPLPWIQGGKIYGEVGGEDEAGYLPTKLAYMVGFYLTGLFEQGALDLRAEYANNHVPGAPNVWYNHSIYTSGYTYKGTVLGHHMGSDADDLFFQLSKEFTEDLSFMVSFDQERHFLSSPVHERKREVVVEVKSRFGFLRPWWISSYEFELIQNHNGVSGEKARNHYLTNRLEFVF
jgi:hypothetical protein